MARHVVDTRHLAEDLSVSKYPAGLGGCRAHGKSLECCEYNVTVFDGRREGDQIRKIGDGLVRIHHASLGESDPDILQRYEHMEILSDPQWNLGAFLSKVQKKKERLRSSAARGCLVDAAYFATRARQGTDDPLSPAWLKCAAYLVCDALALLNRSMRSPTHMLEYIRKFEKNKANESFLEVSQILGLERATPSLLERMLKSAVGFSEMTEKNNHPEIIKKKYEYLVSRSLLSDCYFYLGYVTKNNLVSIRDAAHKTPEIIHVLKVALDIEADRTATARQALALHKTANELLDLRHHA
jgi:hypothetical protein